jgi:hypothetical protein
MTIIEMWWLSLAIFGVVIVVVAILLGLIIATAKSIDRHAAEIWIEGKKIAGNTVSIWILEKVDQQAEGMSQALKSIEHTARSMDEKLGRLGGLERGRG